MAHFQTKQDYGGWPRSRFDRVGSLLIDYASQIGFPHPWPLMLPWVYTRAALFTKFVCPSFEGRSSLEWGAPLQQGASVDLCPVSTWWALYIPFEFVQSLFRHLGRAIGNVSTCPTILWTLHSHWIGSYSAMVLCLLELVLSTQVINW